MIAQSIPFQHNQCLNSPNIDGAKEFLNTRIDRREITSVSSGKLGSNIINLQALGKTLVFGVNWKDQVHITSGELSTFHLIMPIVFSVENRVIKQRAYPGDILICSPGKSVDLIWDKGCRAYVTTIDIHALKHHFQVDTNGLRMHGTQIIHAKERTSQSLSCLLSCISQQHNIFNGNIDIQMQKHFESILMDTLADTILTKDMSILPAHVKIAVEWITSDLHRPFDINELIALCGCSRRSLENGFKRYVGMSPAKYVLSQKLNTLNNIFQKGSSELVGELAFQFGFTSPSHFTKLYKVSFGETPSETIGKRSSIFISKFNN